VCATSPAAGGVRGPPPDSSLLARFRSGSSALTIASLRSRRYYYSEGWRPILPLSFIKAYPKLHALIQECWRVRRKERPNFDEIVNRLQGDIGDEIKRKEEPKIELYSEEDDEIYRNRIGKEDEIEESDDEDQVATGRHTRKTLNMQKEHEKAMGKLRSELEKKHAGAGDAALAQQHRKTLDAKEAAMMEMKNELWFRRKKEQEWTDVFRELREKHDITVEKPADLSKAVGEHAQAMRGVMEELAKLKGGE
jgi:hypothetical protein